MPGIVPVSYAKLIQDKKTRTAVDDLAKTERVARQNMIDLHWRYYEGDHERPLNIRSGEPDQNVIVNLSGVAVDKLATFVGVPTLEVHLVGADGEPVKGVDQVRNESTGRLEERRLDEQKALDAIWEANDLKMFMGDLLLSSMVSGHAFVRIDVDDDDPDSWPTCEPLDPRYIQTFWDVSRVSQRLFYRLMWEMGDVVRMQDIVPDWLYAAGADERPVRRQPVNWHIVEYEQKSGGKWEQIGDDVWNMPFAPVVDWKNSRHPHRYYGRPDMRPALNDSINFTLSDIKKIQYHHAGPQTVLTGGKMDDEQETGPGTIIEIADPEAKLFNLEMQSDLQSSMEFYRELRAAFFGERRVIDPASVTDKLGQLTNFALRVFYTDQLDIGDERRDFHGKGVEEVSRRLLALAGIEASVRAKWGDMLPINRSEAVNTLAVEVDTLKVTSRQTASADLGRDFEKEQAQRDEEQLNETDALANFQEAMGNRGFVPGGVR